ncbi:MAG TPA: tripartite tricarboxylate transporter substrate binding protein [Casimicrobiaceae bacterium]|nr:tripartite tricarboxylate transporter substrate binding protein [Casimicrobiaceae bacterium]
MQHAKRRLAIAAVTIVAATLTGAALAQPTYPVKPIRLLVPFTPGGGTDILARIIAQKMSESMGQQVIVDNKPGGNTLVATEIVARAAPDGYTLILQTNNLAANPTLYKGKMSFDTLKDLEPVSLVAGNPHVLVVHPSVPVTTLKEYVALAKAKPGTVTFATAGSGTVNHLTGELLKMQAGIDIVHVPYKGSGSVMPDLLGGQVNSLFAAMPTVTAHIKDKRLRPIAVTTPKRFAGLPDVPTIAESGYPGYDFSSWFGILAPAGTPKPVVDRLHAEVVKALQEPSVQAKLGDYVIYGLGPQEFASFIRNEIDKTAKVIEASGAKVD